MQRSLLLSLMFWILEVVLVLALVSDDWLQTVQHTEDRWMAQYLGAEKDNEIHKTATEWFDRLFVRTGVQETVYRYFIPSEQERQRSIGFENTGRNNLFPFVAARIQVLWESIYQTLRRLLFILSWWPFLIAALLPFALDGLVQRKIKQSNFDYSSPLAHRSGLFAMLGVFYVLLVGLTLPFPVPPQILPVAWVVMAVSLNVSLAHTQKRI